MLAYGDTPFLTQLKCQTKNSKTEKYQAHIYETAYRALFSLTKRYTKVSTPTSEIFTAVHSLEG
jgi:hypothetical protein